MMMGNGKPKLWKCEYDPPGSVMLKMDKLAEGERVDKIGISTEQKFREFAEANKHLMSDVDLSAARFKKDECRAKGCYWNLSVLIIPIAGSKNYYRVAYFS
jgi:hypothetical protein